MAGRSGTLLTGPRRLQPGAGARKARWQQRSHRQTEAAGAGEQESEPRAAASARQSASGLPFAACVMNVLFALRCHLALSERLPTFCPCCSTRVRAELEFAKSQPHRGRHLRGFAALLAADPDALYHVYVVAVLAMDRAWVLKFEGAGAGGSAVGAASGGDLRLMSFPSLLAGAIQLVLRELAAMPRSCAVLRVRVLGSES